jgi:hypothetical protein
MSEGELKMQIELYLGKSMQSIMFEAEEINKETTDKGIMVDPNPLCDYYTKNDDIIRLLDEAKKEVDKHSEIGMSKWFKKWFGTLEK